MSAKARKEARIEHQQTVLRLLDALSMGAAPEEALAKVCKALVETLPDFKFATYSLEGEDVMHVPCAQERFEVHYVPMEVERSFVRFVKEGLTRTDAAIFDKGQVWDFIPPECRNVWRCHSCLAFSVRREGRRLAVVVLFHLGDAPPSEGERAAYLWLLRIAARVAGAVCSVRLLTDENDALQGRIREQQREFEALRLSVREYLGEFDRLRRVDPDKTIRYADLQPLVLQGATELLRFAESEGEARKASVGAAFRAFAFTTWVYAGLDDRRVKVIVGLRGTGKSKTLLAIMNLLRERGVRDSQMVHVDFGDISLRRFQTMPDVLGHLQSLPEEGGVRHLFLNDVSRTGWHSALLRRLSEMEGWNVWAASSTSGAVGEGDPFTPYAWVSTFRVWSNPNLPRPRSVLRTNWALILLRDLDAGAAHCAIRAQEALAGYFSDHLGELNSLREIALEMNARGCEMSTNTIRAYRRSLESVYLIETTEVYDTFEQRVVKNCCGRVFWTDLDLRCWRFGAAPEHEAARVAMNVLYLQLRATYAHVYTPSDRSADFVTIEKDGRCRRWMAPIEDAAAAAFLRMRGGGNRVKTDKS